MLDKRDTTLSSSTEATSSASSINVTSNSNLTNLRIVQSLNYHGNQLTSFLKDLPEFRNLDLRNVDYGLYQRRTKDGSMEDRGRRLLIHRFISQNFNSLFNDPEPKSSANLSNNDEKNGKVETTENNTNTDPSEATAIVPPLETFFKVHDDDRERHFFDLLEPFDLLFCRVWINNGLDFLKKLFFFICVANYVLLN